MKLNVDIGLFTKPSKFVLIKMVHLKKKEDAIVQCQRYPVVSRASIN